MSPYKSGLISSYSQKVKRAVPGHNLQGVGESSAISKQQNSRFHNLPTTVIRDIFDQTQALDLVSLTLVCKKFHDVVGEPSYCQRRLPQALRRLLAQEARLTEQSAHWVTRPYNLRATASTRESTEFVSNTLVLRRLEKPGTFEIRSLLRPEAGAIKLNVRSGRVGNLATEVCTGQTLMTIGSANSMTVKIGFWNLENPRKHAHYIGNFSSSYPLEFSAEPKFCVAYPAETSKGPGVCLEVFKQKSFRQKLMQPWKQRWEQHQFSLPEYYFAQRVFATYDGRFIVAAAGDSMFVWNRTRPELKAFIADAAEGYSLDGVFQFSPDNRYLLVTFKSRVANQQRRYRLSVWDLSEEILKPKAIIFVPDGTSHIAFGGHGATVTYNHQSNPWVWDPLTMPQAVQLASDEILDGSTKTYDLPNGFQAVAQSDYTAGKHAHHAWFAGIWRIRNGKAVQYGATYRSDSDVGALIPHKGNICVWKVASTFEDYFLKKTNLGKNYTLLAPEIRGDAKNGNFSWTEIESYQWGSLSPNRRFLIHEDDQRNLVVKNVSGSP